MTQVSQVMTRGVRTMSPNETVMKAAQAMSELDVGVIPVCDGRKVVGMVTDRDIVVRGLARGCQPDAPLREVMSGEPLWCFEDQSVEEVVRVMGDSQVRRVPVVDREKHLVGILSLGDVAVRASGTSDATAGQTLEEISEPSRPDRSGKPQG